MNQYHKKHSERRTHHAIDHALQNIQGMLCSRRLRHTHSQTGDIVGIQAWKRVTFQEATARGINILGVYEIKILDGISNLQVSGDEVR